MYIAQLERQLITQMINQFEKVRSANRLDQLSQSTKNTASETNFNAGQHNTNTKFGKSFKIKERSTILHDPATQRSASAQLS